MGKLVPSIDSKIITVLSFATLLISPLTSLGQSAVSQVKRTHTINPYAMPSSAMQNIKTLNIVAVMVEFQPDSNAFTTGTGVFGPGSIPFLESDAITIDPLPHNQAYFNAHLEFIKNYYEHVSAGKLTVQYQLLPTIVQLDEPMAAFSPTGETFTFAKIAHMVRQTWNKVDEAGGFDASGLDPEKTAFVLFHAGVGRDIELTGQTLDRTPQDIPSVYMSKRALRVSLDEPDFNGIPVNNGTFRVTNSLVIPRTLSRRGEDILGNPFVIQLSINGILAANIGSHLGLPDLFNTREGTSGIGRFGLMDGEGFLGFAGLFPPEPSAWEKIRMGWQVPFTINLDNEDRIHLPAASFHQSNSIAKQIITNDEFFLVENRHRDPNNNGVDLTIKNVDGLTTTINFTNADTSFSPVSADLPDLLPAGVLVDVSNFDWALPGGLDIGPDEEAFTGDDRNLNGGMLIWHIDEAVIEDKIDDLAVNNNPFRRGVDLEEADGPQDIGRALPNIFGTDDVGRGTPFDFWWSGNNSFVISPAGDTLRLFENRFGPDTRPNNNSNSGAPTFFEFFDFSGNFPTASFRARETAPENISKRNLPIQILENTATAIPADDNFTNFYPVSLTPFITANDTFLIVPAAQKTVAVPINSSQSGVFEFPGPPSQQPLIMNETLFLAERPDDSSTSISLAAWKFNQPDRWVNIWQTDIATNRGFISSNNRDTLLADFTRVRINPQNGAFWPPLSEPAISTSSRAGFNGTLTATDLLSPLFGRFNQVSVTSFKDDSRLYPFAVQLNSNENGFALLTDNSLELVSESDNTFSSVFESNTFMEWPAIADVDNNGRSDFLFVDEATGQLHGRTRNGSNLNFFPILPPDGTRFFGTPLLTDIESDGINDLLIIGQDSLSINIYGYTVEGRRKPNFPLFVGSVESPGLKPIHTVLTGNQLLAVSHRGEISAWEFPNAAEPLYPYKYGSPTFNKPFSEFRGTNNGEAFSGVLNKNETYNWPNPANLETFLRFQLSDAGKVDIEVISMSGSVMIERKIDVANSAPVELRLDTASWGSGAYYARIEANVNGNTERKIVKIAIVH